MDCCCYSLQVDPYDSPSKTKYNKDGGTTVFGCFGCLQKRLHILPIISTIWFGICIITSYIISVSLGHTEADFPYVSHTARDHPETNIFAQMINIGAVLLIFNAVLRYLYIKDALTHQRSTSGWYRANVASFVFGIIIALGFSMTANFQTNTIKSVHYIGAGLGFGGGVIYCWMQTCFTWKLYRRELHRGYVATIQTVCSVALVVFLLFFGISKTVYKIQEAKNMGTKYDSLRAVYLVSTITEWIAIVILNVFMLTFIPDFKSIELRSPQIYRRLDKTESIEKLPKL